MLRVGEIIFPKEKHQLIIQYKMFSSEKYMKLAFCRLSMHTHTFTHMHTHIHTHMQEKLMKKCLEFDRDKGVYGRFWREEREGTNVTTL